MSTKSRWAVFGGAAVLALLALVSVGSAEEQQVLVGEYDWSSGGKGDIEARFTPTGEATWKVSFRFRFRGKSHTWKGTAEGSLAGGELSGVVRHRGREFEFKGAFEGDTYHATHAEKEGGKLFDTGTMTLSRS